MHDERYSIWVSTARYIYNNKKKKLTRESRGKLQIPARADEYFPQLKECVDEAARMLPNFNSSYANYTNMQLAQLFVNTTACVLAKTRCSYTNPVTGELHDDDIVNKLHLPSLNALFVNTDYDINIVQLPFRHGSVDVCTKYRNVQQATWPSVVC